MARTVLAAIVEGKRLTYTRAAMTQFDTIAILTVAAAMFGYVNHKTIKLPFAIGIMVASVLGSLFIMLIAALLPSLGAGELFREILSDIDFAEALMHGMLSFLLFAGALHTDMDRLRKWAKPIAVLASIGVLISTGVNWARVVRGVFGVGIRHPPDVLLRLWRAHHPQPTRSPCSAS